MSGKVAVISGFHISPKFLKTLFESLNKQLFKDFDVYIYNNSGTDYSHVFNDAVYFFDYFFINLDKNVGFAGGNNKAMIEARKRNDYAYYALVNDDTKPDPGWLEELVKTAGLDPTIGAVSSKMVFFEKFLTVTGKTQSASVFDPRKLGIRLYNNTSFEGCFYNKKFYKKGFFNEETDEINPFRWTGDEFSLELPVSSVEGNVRLKLFIQKNHKIIGQFVDVFIGGSKITRILLKDDQIYYEVIVPVAVMEKHRHFIIQNAGSAYDSQYNGYDIGSGEIDNMQHDESIEIPMCCGGSCLFSTAALEKTGLFNNYFFSYYEDSDLSLRIRKKGFKIVYSPGSRILHYHAATSKEWSPFFTYHVFRNKIIFAGKNFGAGAFLFVLKERSRETWFFLKCNIRARFKDAALRSRLKLNVLIIKDAVIGMIKYHPGKFE